MGNILGSIFKNVYNNKEDSEEYREKLYNAMADYGVRYSKKLEDDVKALSDRDLMEKYGKINVVVVSEITGMPYNETLKKMDNVRNKYNISYQVYADEKLYLYEGEELAKKIGNIRVRNEAKLKLIVADTGWTRLKAIREVAKFNQKWTADYNRYANYRFYEKSDEEIKAKYDKWNKTGAENRKIVQEACGWPMYKIRVHMRRVAIQYNIIPAYYVLYRAWELTDEQLASYATQDISRQLMIKYTTLKERNLLSNKSRFDEIYKDYINRKYWINNNTSYEEFLEFIDGIDEIFCKPFKSGGGLGAERMKADHDNPKLQYDYLMGRGRLLVEECVKQHHLVNEFISSSVNTIRVVTIVHNGECQIISTGMRFGYDGVTDNFSGNGLVADVDKDTGIIVTDAIDKKGNIYKEHPKSGKTFKGFQVPLWDQVIKLAKDAMDVLETINFVGWDIAICEDKVVIIEGNPMPDLVLVQAPYANIKEGKRVLFEKYLDD